MSTWRRTKVMTMRLTLPCVAVSVTAALWLSTASASCIPSTAAQQHARASVIFDGVALEGPTPTGVQRFRVSRYLKGSGPRIVRVNTGYIKRAADDVPALARPDVHRVFEEARAGGNRVALGLDDLERAAVDVHRVDEVVVRPDEADAHSLAEAHVDRFGVLNAAEPRSQAIEGLSTEAVQA